MLWPTGQVSTVFSRQSLDLRQMTCAVLMVLCVLGAYAKARAALEEPCEGPTAKPSSIAMGGKHEAQLHCQFVR